jgi:hypothetical protein
MVTKGSGSLRNQADATAPTHAAGTIAVQYVIKLLLVMIVTMAAAGALGARVGEIFANVSTGIS